MRKTNRLAFWRASTYQNVASVCLMALLFCSSCSRPAHESNTLKLITPKNSKVVDANEYATLLKNIEVVQFETTEECMLGDIMAVHSTDSSLFVLSGGMSMSSYEVFHFTRSGKFLNRIGQKGNARNEYLSILTFFVNEEDRTVILNDQNKQCFLVYSYEGEYIATYPYTDKFSFLSHVTHHNGAYYFSNMINFDNYTLFGKSSTRLDSIVPISKTIFSAVGAYRFSTSPHTVYDDKIYLVHPLSDTLWCYAHEEMKPYARFQWADEAISAYPDEPVDYSDFRQAHRENVVNGIMGVVGGRSNMLLSFLDGRIVWNDKTEKALIVEDGVEMEKLKGLYPTLVRGEIRGKYCAVMERSSYDRQVEHIQQNRATLPDYLEGKIAKDEANNPVLVLFDIDF